MANFEETDRMALQAGHTPKRRKIVCLCGSTKFWRVFQRAGLEETMRGNIVLSIGAASGTDGDHFGNLAPEEYNAIKNDLDTLHYDKIAMSDEILVLDDLRDGRPYIGTSTAAEIVFASRMGKRVRYWSWEHFLTENGPFTADPVTPAEADRLNRPAQAPDLAAARRALDAAEKAGLKFTVGSDPAGGENMRDLIKSAAKQIDEHFRGYTYEEMMKDPFFQVPVYDPSNLTEKIKEAYRRGGWMPKSPPFPFAADGEYMPMESAGQLADLLKTKTAEINKRLRADLAPYAGFIPEAGDADDNLIAGIFKDDNGRYFLRGVYGENIPDDFGTQVKILISGLYEYARSKSYSPAFGNWLELIYLFLENKASMQLTAGGDAKFYNRPDPVPAARMVAGLYDFGDDGRTFIVSSELPGRRGKLTYTSKDVAIAKILTILNEYSGPHEASPNDIEFAGPKVIAQLTEEYNMFEISGAITKYRPTNAIYTSGRYNPRAFEACRDLVKALASWLDVQTLDPVYGDTLTSSFNDATGGKYAEFNRAEFTGKPEAAPDGPPAKLVFGLYRWPGDRDGAYYSLRTGSGVTTMGNRSTVRSEIMRILDAEKPDPVTFGDGQVGYIGGPFDNVDEPAPAAGRIIIGPETEQLTLKVNRDGDPTVEIDDEPDPEATRDLDSSCGE
jgi:hypothetical protein